MKDSSKWIRLLSCPVTQSQCSPSPAPVVNHLIITIHSSETNFVWPCVRKSSVYLFSHMSSEYLCEQHVHRYLAPPRWDVLQSSITFHDLQHHLQHNTSPGNPVEFNQSTDNFDTPEVFPLLCAICIRRLANGPWAWCLRLRLATQ